MVNCSSRSHDRNQRMPEGLWIPLAIIAVVAVYVLAKVRHYMRQSDEQWRQVDKSKLREWDDEDDWDR